MMELKRPDEALKLYDAALRIKPAFFTALSNRARALIELKRPEDALTSVDRALALNPQILDAHSVRGNALLDLDRHVEAIESYDRAISPATGQSAAPQQQRNCIDPAGSNRRGNRTVRSCDRLGPVRASVP